MKQDVSMRGKGKVIAIAPPVAAALLTLCLSAPTAECFSLIWYNEKDCRALVTGDKYDCVSDDCKAILKGDKYACKSEDCRAILEHDKYKCKSDDCRAFVRGDKYGCKSLNCRAILTSDKFKCGQ